MISGKTRIVGIFGYPVEHSLSPNMHNAEFKSKNLDFVYVPFPVKPENLKSAVYSIRALNLTGVNVTVPHKQTVIKYLDDISQEAKLIGAVNTIHNSDGKLTGYNTDGPGFIESLKRDGKYEPSGKNAFILGAGGAAHAIGVMLAKSGVRTIVIYDIVKTKRQKLVKHLKKFFKKCLISSIEINSPKMPEIMDNTHILLNVTPVGMHESDPLPFDINLLHKNMFVYDVIYNRETKLLKYARKKGLRTLNGLGMLVRQGAISFEIWTHRKPDLNIMKRALNF